MECLGTLMFVGIEAAVGGTDTVTCWLVTLPDDSGVANVVG